MRSFQKPMFFLSLLILFFSALLFSWKSNSVLTRFHSNHTAISVHPRNMLSWEKSGSHCRVESTEQVGTIKSQYDITLEKSRSCFHKSFLFFCCDLINLFTSFPGRHGRWALTQCLWKVGENQLIKQLQPLKKETRYCEQKNCSKEKAWKIICPHVLQLRKIGKEYNPTTVCYSCKGWMLLSLDWPHKSQQHLITSCICSTLVGLSLHVWI